MTVSGLSFTADMVAKVAALHPETLLQPALGAVLQTLDEICPDFISYSKAD